MDEQTKAKGLMAGGLFILAAIGLVVVLVVLPAVHDNGGSPTAVAQVGGPGAPMPGPGAMPGAPGGPEPGMGGMPGGPQMPGMGGAPTGAPAVPAAGAPAKAMEPLEPSRENPFAPMGAVAGAKQGKLRPGLAFTPGPRQFPISLREQNRYPSVGPNGESIHVPSSAPPKRPGGPELPPGESGLLSVVGIGRDPQGLATVLARGPGGQSVVLKVGDRYQGWLVAQITDTVMVLVKKQDGKEVRRTIRLETSGLRRPTGTGTRVQPGGQRPGVTVPGARRPTPGGAAPGGGAGTQPGVRRPGGVRPGAFPGVGGAQQ